MTEKEDAPAKNEAAVLSDQSLKALAKEMVNQNKGLVYPMYLNIPTTQVVRMRLTGTEKENSEEDMCTALLLYWKKMRETARDKDKVLDLERACRQMGELDIADTITDRHNNNMELSEDCFPAA
ncbi:hypothetical protein LSH36_188g05022 [Paralvinella palmiformis]|uniref:Uncharacterized protein n=1 Tax=Paralvinella palmiformis TaxID=53620 RepID=A0AAD9JRH4_9ANNE|nr:hypothetical protein LSH36_188g05022 [Paralvinella palmiformis]